MIRYNPKHQSLTGLEFICFSATVINEVIDLILTNIPQKDGEMN